MRRFIPSARLLTAAAFLALGAALAVAGAPNPNAPEFTDTFSDGTPDQLRLYETADREAFVRWFTFLAEAEYLAPPADRAPEITDCAGLLRFAYREALRKHDGAWATGLRLREVPPLASIRAYNYPHTPLGASMFRVVPGPLRPEDVNSDAFRQFADADKLQKFNTHFVSREIGQARPGDLLFFRQPDQRSPWHAMIFLGHSPFSSDGEEWVVYHTGPTGKDPGELRRLSVPELLNFPFTRWRPLPNNPAFLGVYRWNILREAD
ncbi:MAG TPA: DUF1175 family protein [Terriglobales bacterium]|nr:DUF1175 family protein [Terriglobales bacterium]